MLYRFEEHEWGSNVDLKNCYFCFCLMPISLPVTLIGNGKMIVEFCSTDMELRVCRYRN